MKGELLQFGRGTLPGNPIRSDVELAQRLRELCGAEGYRIENGVILALRWDLDGNEKIIDRFEAVAVNG